MKVSKISHSFRMKAVLIVLVLISLRAGEKSAKADTISNNIYSLADIQLEKEIQANQAWNNYISFRKELIWYEKTFPRLLEYDTIVGKYSLKESNVVSENDYIIAEQILYLLDNSKAANRKALELKQEALEYEDRFKNFS